jgi:SAM-dependent methyltransferase
VEPRTRQQLLRLSADFYRAHATGFDASRGHQPWPGWERLLEWLPEPGGTTLSVLDVGCGNARLATFLAGAGHRVRYVGIDANAALLDAARERLAPELAARCELIETDFLATSSPGASLPEGPFDFVALFGVLHHVPGRDWRTLLLRELVERAAPGGLIAIAAWQFAGRERFARRTVEWHDVGPILGERIDRTQLEKGDTLLRFGPDPEMPPRYCHQVADEELDDLATTLAGFDLEVDSLADYRADGSEGDLNRYRVLRRRTSPLGPPRKNLGGES